MKNYKSYVKWFAGESLDDIQNQINDFLMGTPEADRQYIELTNIGDNSNAYKVILAYRELEINENN